MGPGCLLCCSPHVAHSVVDGFRAINLAALSGWRDRQHREWKAVEAEAPALGVGTLLHLGMHAPWVPALRFLAGMSSEPRCSTPPGHRLSPRCWGPART